MRSSTAVLLVAGLLVAPWAQAAYPVVDGDGDGVSDEVDHCLYTPAGIPVGADGCSTPGDEDEDGVPEALDNCPLTPAGARVDAQGCALDEDIDGIADGIDQCPGTPQGAAVGADGCRPGEKPMIARAPLRRPVPGAAVARAPLPRPRTAPVAPPVPIVSAPVPPASPPSRPFPPPVAAPAPMPAPVAAPVPLPPAQPAPVPLPRPAPAPLPPSLPSAPAPLPPPVPSAPPPPAPPPPSAPTPAPVPPPPVAPVVAPAPTSGPAPPTEAAPTPVVPPSPRAAPISAATSPAPVASGDGERYLTLEFPPSSTKLTIEWKAILARQAASLSSLLAQRPQTNLIIVGHADAATDTGGADAVAARRAAVVHESLVALALPPERMTVRARGSREPRFTGADSPRNRRVDLYLYESPYVPVPSAPPPLPPVPVPIVRAPLPPAAVPIVPVRPPVAPGAAPRAAGAARIRFGRYSSLLDDGAMRALDAIADAAVSPMRTSATARLVITGSTGSDETGRAAEGLAEGRAAVIRNYLLSLGLPRDRVEIGAPEAGEGGRVRLVR